MKILYIYLTDVRKTWANILQTLQMCEALSKVHEVNFFHPFLLRRTLDKRLSFFHIEKGFRITRIVAFGPLKTKYLDFANRIVFFFQILFYLYFSKYDLIYTRDYSFLVFLSKIPRFLRPKNKIVYESHKVYYYASNKVNELKQEIESLKLANMMVAISKGVRHDLIQLGVDKNKIRVIPNGVKIDRFFIKFDPDSFRKNNNISKNEVVIIFVGSWKLWKMGALIRAYVGVLRKVKNSKLILVGGYPKNISQTQELVEKLNIDKGNILLTGYISQIEMIKYLKISDIGVIPDVTTTEGIHYASPLKLFEYMAAGLAIVAPDLPSIREIVTVKEAVFFEPENEYDLAAKLIDLINDKLKRERMRLLMGQRVKEFTYEERSKKVTEVIEMVIEK